MDEIGLFERSGRQERVLFPIHPTALSSYSEFLGNAKAIDAADEGLCVWAVPTSSTRTLLAWPDGVPEKAIFVKTSLVTPILGDRRVTLKKAARGIGFSMILEQSRGSLPAAFVYFPESVGFIPRRYQTSGVIIRSIPQQIKNDDVVVAPLFSLYGEDADHPPLFFEILSRNRVQPIELIEGMICAPFAELWLEMSMHLGLLLEAHGQDVMIALTPELIPSGQFFYRDLEGIQADWDLRRSNGFSLPDRLPLAWSWNETYGAWGYRYSQLVWYKIYSSLFNYVDMVLKELECAARIWHGRGLIAGKSIAENDVTMIFSNHMFSTINRVFGVPIGRVYNIFHRRTAFLTFLMKLRRESVSMGNRV